MWVLIYYISYTCVGVVVGLTAIGLWRGSRLLIFESANGFWAMRVLWLEQSKLRLFGVIQVASSWVVQATSLSTLSSVIPLPSPQKEPVNRVPETLIYWPCWLFWHYRRIHQTPIISLSGLLIVCLPNRTATLRNCPRGFAFIPDPERRPAMYTRLRSSAIFNLIVMVGPIHSSKVLALHLGVFLVNIGDPIVPWICRFLTPEDSFATIEGQCNIQWILFLLRNSIAVIFGRCSSRL